MLRDCLMSMYETYAVDRGWRCFEKQEDSDNSNSNNQRMEGQSRELVVNGRGAYEALQYESGIHKFIRRKGPNEKLNTSLVVVIVMPQVDSSRGKYYLVS